MSFSASFSLPVPPSGEVMVLSSLVESFKLGDEGDGDESVRAHDAGVLSVAMLTNVAFETGHAQWDALQKRTNAAFV